MNADLAATPVNDVPAAEPWWRVGMVWCVLGGPAIVVVASLATAVLAHIGADPVVNQSAQRLRQGQSPDAATPALLARNHAATAAAAAAASSTATKARP